MKALYLWIAAALLLPGPAIAQTQRTKSVEEIVNGLLGGQSGATRVAKGVRHTERPSVPLPLHFDYDSATITSESIAQLHLVAEALNSESLRTQHFLIEGHTDTVGSAAFNQDLSERRAGAVKRYLTDNLGVDAARLQTTGFGFSHPLPGVSQDTDEGRAQQRRVVLVNLDAGVAPAAAKELPAAAADASTAIAVDVAVKYQKGGQTNVLPPGGSLTPDDDYRITFTASRSGYVYVYQFDSAGKTDLLFPNPEYSPERNPVVGERNYSVPPEGQWLALDHTRGHEDIVVLASDQPLGEAQAIATDIRGQDVQTAAQTVSGVSRGVRGGQAAGLFAYRLGFEHR